jgi:hypothetical protein
MTLREWGGHNWLRTMSNDVLYVSTVFGFSCQTVSSNTTKMSSHSCLCDSSFSMCNFYKTENDTVTMHCIFVCWMLNGACFKPRHWWQPFNCHSHSCSLASCHSQGSLMVDTWNTRTQAGIRGWDMGLQPGCTVRNLGQTDSLLTQSVEETCTANRHGLIFALFAQRAWNKFMFGKTCLPTSFHTFLYQN